MADFNNTVVTNIGIALTQRMQYAEKSLTFTKIEAGDGLYTGERLEDAESLKDKKQEFPVSSFSIADDNVVKVTAVMSNESLHEAYYIREIGLYANDPESGQDVLYAITTAAGMDKADYYPPYNGQYPITITVELYIAVSNDVNVAVEGVPGAYASAKDLADFKTIVAKGENAISFDSGDIEAPEAWEDVPVIEGGEKHKSLLWKLSTMARNVRYLFKVLGSTDISQVQGGTVTGAIAARRS